MLRDGLPPPPEMTRPEVAAVLIGHYRKREESIPAVSSS
jgi:ATP sulfurylase